jgi:ABC-2 type transport system permease protein
VLFSVVIALASNVLGQFADTDPARLRAALAAVASALGWSPFGWAWAIPADVAHGDWLVAGIHLVLAAGLVVGLWWGWAYVLERRLTSPVEQPGDSRPVRESGWVDRIFPDTPAGGVAARTLRYWRRDPRYLAGVAGFLVGPIILIVLQVINPMGNGLVAVFAPTLVGLLVGLSLAQDLSFDGSALWLHIGSGLRGADDRAGRAWSALVIFVPMILVLLLVSLAITGSWGLAAPAAALSLGSALAGLGVGSVVGALWQWPAPPPGANPFASSNQGGLPSLLSVTVTTLGTLVVSLPTLALVVWSIFTPWAGTLALVVGLASGLLVFKIGIGWGGRLLERRWPEALSAVSERVG